MILMPLPAADFDPTEAAVTWKLFTAAGIQVQFATPVGEPTHGDGRTLTGIGLGPFGRLLRARSDAVSAYCEMEMSEAFARPLPYESVHAADYDGVILPGGHAPGMRSYLESRTLQSKVVDFFRSGRPVGAICHGVLLAARSIDPRTGRSVLYDRRTTSLLSSQEIIGWRMTRRWAGNRYKTYKKTVEQEVRTFLKDDESQFQRGPTPLLRDSAAHSRRGFVVRDARYVSARWPGDVYAFARELLTVVGEWRATSGKREHVTARVTVPVDVKNIEGPRADV